MKEWIQNKKQIVRAFKQENGVGIWDVVILVLATLFFLLEMGHLIYMGFTHGFMHQLMNLTMPMVAFVNLTACEALILAKKSLYFQK